MSILYYTVIIPVAAAFIIALIGKKIKPAGGIIASCVSAVLLTITVYLCAPVVTRKIIMCSSPQWVPPYGISLVIDAFSVFVLVLANLVALLVALYSTVYMRAYTDKWKYFSLFMLVVAGANGVLVTGDIFNLYVFLEIASISIYALTAFGLEEESFEAAFKYAVMGAVASAFILLGIAFLYAYTSTLNMADMAAVIAAKGCGKAVWFVGILFLMGFGMKAAAVPFHAWLPDAYSKAPVTVPALSSGVLLKVLGIYSLSRIFFNVLGMTGAVSTILITLAILTMVIGAFMAFAQTDVRRLYAYSGISQIGYILLGLGIGTPLAIFGSVFHMFNHSTGKALLFLSSGVVEEELGTTDIRKMSGVFSRSKVCGFSHLAGVLSMCGIPPLTGFWSKVIIIFACIQAGKYGVGFVAVVVSMLTIAYYFKAFTPVLFGPGDGIQVRVSFPGARGGYMVNAVLIALSVIMIMGGALLLPGIANTVMNNASGALANGAIYAQSIFGGAR